MPRYAKIRHATRRYATPREDTPRQATPSNATPSQWMQSHGKPRYAKIRHSKPMNAKSRQATLRQATQSRDAEALEGKPRDAEHCDYCRRISWGSCDRQSTESNKTPSHATPRSTALSNRAPIVTMRTTAPPRVSTWSNGKAPEGKSCDAKRPVTEHTDSYRPDADTSFQI
jgi:hypothetical protein